MENGLKLFMIMNDLESEETTKYIKLLHKGEVTAFVDKKTGDILKKRTKDKPDNIKIGNVNNIILYKIVASTGSQYLGRRIISPTTGENKILTLENGAYKVESLINIDEVINISDRELIIRNSNMRIDLQES